MLVRIFKPKRFSVRFWALRGTSGWIRRATTTKYPPIIFSRILSMDFPPHLLCLYQARRNSSCRNPPSRHSLSVQHAVRQHLHWSRIQDRLYAQYDNDNENEDWVSILVPPRYDPHNQARLHPLRGPHNRNKGSQVHPSLVQMGISNWRNSVAIPRNQLLP